ncbi:hypothetical protein GOP47_0028989 [Adiantum capillus-veneris]|nr:hypothetical protein GOP47_0028989 [Adiantum capillus-veneris]
MLRTYVMERAQAIVGSAIAESGVKDAHIMWVGYSIGGVQAAGGQGGLSASGIVADKEGRRAWHTNAGRHAQLPQKGGGRMWGGVNRQRVAIRR